MPRTAKAREREPYKPDMTGKVDELELKRLALGVSIEDLAARAGMTERQLRRVRKSGRAWKREIHALRMALRSIEADQKAEAELFGGDDETAGEGGQGRT